MSGATSSVLQLLCFTVAVSSIPHQVAPRQRWSRLRGGQAAPAAPPDGLSDDEILERLNNVPTFAILTADNEMISLGGKDLSPWHICYSFFTSAAEVQDLLRRTIDANPGTDGLHLGTLPLGHAFAQCGGWAQVDGCSAASEEESKYALQGPSEGEEAVEALTADVASGAAMPAALLRDLEECGVSAGTWLLPVFFSEGFQTADMLPAFLSEADFAAGWRRTGREDAERPAALRVMDVRALVARMRRGDGPTSWRKLRLVSTVEAYELAQELAGDD